MHRDRVTGVACLAAVILLSASPSFALDFKALRHGGVLRVGTAGDYAPFSVAKGEQYEGFDIDLVTRLVHDLGARVEYVRFRWPDLTSNLSDDRFDVAVSGITVRPERALAGRFTRPYAVTSALALIRREDRQRFTDRAALDKPGVRIAVNRGGYLEQLARKLFPHAAIEPIADNRSLPERVLVGTDTAALTDSLEAQAWERRELTTVGSFSRDRKAILVRADAPELAQWIDEWLVQRERDGWLRKLRQRWFHDTMFAVAGADREAVLSDIELRCRLMPAVAATKIAHDLPFEDPVQERHVLDRAQATARTIGIDPNEVARLFNALIRAAKAIQVGSGTNPHAFAPPLEQLRSTIADLDAHLIRQLWQAARSVKPAEWRNGLREGVNVDGLGGTLQLELADALAHTRRLISRERTFDAVETPKAK